MYVQVVKEDDANWPPPDRVGRQELEIVLGSDHISFATTKLGSLLQVGCCCCTWGQQVGGTATPSWQSSLRS